MEEQRGKKIFLMKVSVGAIAALIVLFWFFNFQKVWETNKIKSQNDSETAKWEDLKQEIGKSLGGVEERLSNLENDKSTLVKNADGLLEDVLQETEKYTTSTAPTSSESILTASSTATTTATSTDYIILPPDDSLLNKNSCPSYINCMPTIGESRPCQVPPGCEGITQIAY